MSEASLIGLLAGWLLFELGLLGLRLRRSGRAIRAVAGHRPSAALFQA